MTIENDKTVKLSAEELKSAPAVAAPPLSPDAVDKTVKLAPSETKPIAEPAVHGEDGSEEKDTLSSRIKELNPLRKTGTFSVKRDVDAELSQTSMDLKPDAKDDVIDLEAKKPPREARLDERYERLEDFAEGGHAFVSMAKDKTLGRLVALKSLKQEYLDDEKIVGSFVSEARLTSQLEHPSVVPIYSMERDEADGVHLAMKLIRGRTLKEYISQIVQSYNREGAGAFDERKSLAFRLDIFLRVCDALSYAHSRNVMHCDLKPENIMIGEYRETYLMDWGIARLIKEPDFDETKWVKPKTISGTPKYLSPEAINGEHTDQRADVFAMGLILFELATLKTAVGGSDPLEVMNKIRAGGFESLHHRFGEPIDADLRAIIRKAMAVDRNARYSSVNELAEDLRRYNRFAEVSANPDNLPMKCVRWLYNHRTAFAGTLALALLIGAMGVAYALYERMNAIETTREREAAINAAHSNTMESAFGIDRLAMHLQNSLESMADEAVFLLRWDTTAKLDKCYAAADFTNPATAPPDMSYSPVYKLMISPGNFQYKAAPGLPAAQAEIDLRKLEPLGRKMPRVLMNSAPGSVLNPQNEEQAKRRLLESGYPMRWIYMGLSDGFYISYPGKAYPEAYDPRTRPWYKEGAEYSSSHWGSPYIDSSGQGIVLPCTVQLADDEGKLYGVVSMDIAFDYIIEKLREYGNRPPVVVDKYLVNSEGRVVVSTNAKYAGLSYQPGAIANDVPELPFFPDGELLRKMQAERFGAIVVQRAGKERLFSFAAIHSLSLLYVEEIDFEKLLEACPPPPAPGKR